MSSIRVLITGGYGNVGTHAVRDCLARGDHVRVLELPSRTARRAEREFRGRVETVWGDLARLSLEELVEDRDAVIHTAAVLPPASERHPDRAREVNVDATSRLVKACSQSDPPTRLVFTSSIGVYGPTQDLEPPRRVDEPLSPTDTYSTTKVEAEHLIRESDLPWVILRLSAALPVRLALSNAPLLETLFRMRADNRIEFVHPADVGVALAAAAR